VNFPISLIIPILNEEKRLKKGITRILDCCIQEGWDFEIIIVEDGSTDRSVEIIKEFCSKEKRVHLLSLDRRYGKGGALLNAIKQCKKDNIGYLDIDLSADPLEFTRLIPFAKEFDMVIGSRIVRGGLNPVQRPLIRNFLSKMYALYFACLFNMKIYDTQCGFKLFRKESILPIISTIQTNGFAFDTEFLVKSFLHGLNIMEVPINWHHENNSKLNIYKAVFNMSRDLLKIWMNTIILQVKDENIQSKYFVAKPVTIIKAIRKLMTRISEVRSKTTLLEH
jgi:glycosyltransferase involved in cell wall biosynthesis